MLPVKLPNIEGVSWGVSAQPQHTADKPEQLLNKDTPASRFHRGRRAAANALSHLGCHVSDPLAKNASGAPIWPVGFQGSISHSEPWAIAAVRKSADGGGIGVDIERIVSHANCNDLLPIVASAAEAAWVRSFPNGIAVGLTLLFSAKESVYKAIYSVAKRFIDFNEVELAHVKIFPHFRLIAFSDVSLNKLIGPSLQVHYAVSQTHVLTICIW